MKKVVFILLLLLNYSASFCWNGNGHMTGGAIAYYYLKSTNTAALQKVIATLQGHPYYASIWKPQLDTLKTQELKDVTLFMLASTWPDDVRTVFPYGDTTTAKWHYINYRYFPQGFDTTAAGAIPVPNAEGRLQLLLDSIGTKSAVQNGIYLSWIFHITEDIHEPMHTTAMFDKYHPEGDHGGNSTFFMYTGETRDTNKLHYWWDALITGTITTIPGKAQYLLAQPKYSPDSLTELKTDSTIHMWIVNEGVVYAEKVAYRNGYIKGTYTYPTLNVDKGYYYEAQKVAERQIVLAGIRLANELMKIYK